jgi:hypothetical protein
VPENVPAKVIVAAEVEAFSVFCKTSPIQAFVVAQVLPDVVIEPVVLGVDPWPKHSTALKIRRAEKLLNSFILGFTVLGVMAEKLDRTYFDPWAGLFPHPDFISSLSESRPEIVEEDPQGLRPQVCRKPWKRRRSESS